MAKRVSDTGRRSRGRRRQRGEIERAEAMDEGTELLQVPFELLDVMLHPLVQVAPPLQLGVGARDNLALADGGVLVDPDAGRQAMGTKHGEHDDLVLLHGDKPIVIQPTHPTLTPRKRDKSPSIDWAVRRNMAPPAIATTRPPG